MGLVDDLVCDAQSEQDLIEVVLAFDEVDCHWILADGVGLYYQHRKPNEYSKSHKLKISFSLSNNSPFSSSDF